jgi:hypothetical protein
VVSIYCLREPGTRAIRYVGQTTATLDERLKGHVCPSALRRALPLAMWLCELVGAGLLPKIELLETVPAGKGRGPAADAERWWVERLGHHHDLLNIQLTWRGQMLHRSAARASVARKSRQWQSASRHSSSPR